MTVDYIRDLDEHYYMGVFGRRLPAALARGEGMRLYDTSGNSYKDFLSGIGVNALGYSDEGFKEAVTEQIDQLIHTSNYFYSEPQALLAQDLCTRTGYDKVFLGNSGAEANECALKLALKRAHDKGTEKPNFIALRNSFHGRTLASLAITGKAGIQDSYQPPALEVRFVEDDDLEGASAAFDDNTCGAFIEVIQGEGGVRPLSAHFVKGIHKLCRRHDALFMIDEVQSGMGRTGRFLAQDFCGVKADVTTLAKALGNGFPIGACLATDEAAASFSAGDHGSTFGGNHVVCVAARYMCKAIDDKRLDYITEIGENFKYMLFALRGSHPDRVADVRGLGLFLGMQLNEPFKASDVQHKLLDMGFIVGTAGMNTLRFLPPFIVDDGDIEDLSNALDYVLGEEG